jgi:exocyst complex component 2
MVVVKELDNTLFDGYVNPKSEALKTVMRGGILDPAMDWYETPQPTGEFNAPFSLSFNVSVAEQTLSDYELSP